MKKNTVDTLRPNSKNPRKISDEKLNMLKKTIEEFGDLSGIVFNTKTKQLVGGHQRAKVLAKGEITIEKKFPKPTKTGTIAVGFVTFGGEKFSYREVAWPKEKEYAANIAANKGAGEWDLPALSELLTTIEEKGLDMELTLFDKDELADLILFPEEEEEDEKSSGKKKVEFEIDTEKMSKDLKHECPKCGFKFTDKK